MHWCDTYFTFQCHMSPTWFTYSVIQMLQCGEYSRQTSLLGCSTHPIFITFHILVGITTQAPILTMMLTTVTTPWYCIYNLWWTFHVSIHHDPSEHRCRCFACQSVGLTLQNKISGRGMCGHSRLYLKACELVGPQHDFPGRHLITEMREKGQGEGWG